MLSLSERKFPAFPPWTLYGRFSSRFGNLRSLSCWFLSCFKLGKTSNSWKRRVLWTERESSSTASELKFSYRKLWRLILICASFWNFFLNPPVVIWSLSLILGSLFSVTSDSCSDRSWYLGVRRFDKLYFLLRIASESDNSFYPGVVFMSEVFIL